MSKTLISCICLTALLVSCKDGDAIFSDINHPEDDFFVGQSDVQLAITMGQGAATRSSYSEVQGGGTFLGINDLWLIPFSVNSAVEPVSATDSRLAPAYNAGALNSLYTNTNSHLYEMMSATRGTGSYLVYASANSQTTGALTADITAAQPQDYTFTPVGFTLDNTKGQALATYLTAIANATGWEATTDASPLKPLRDHFLQMHAGASLNVQAEVQLLYDRVKDLTDAVSVAIKATIASSDVTVTNDVVTFPEALSGYPANVGLPDGAAAIRWIKNNDDPGTFELTDNLTFSGLNVARGSDYIKPAPLYYRANSCIVTDPRGDMEQYYTSKALWDWNHEVDATKDNSVLGQYENWRGTVRSTTRSVAIINPLQYAVARIDMKLISETATLLDYNDNVITVGTSNFPITGILIPGQYTVGWDFRPKDGATEHIVYDGHLTSSSNATVCLEQKATFDAATSVYSLVYESKAFTAADHALNFAVELRNNSGASFLGIDGEVIPNGCKFYLIGQLNGSADQKAFTQDLITNINLKVASLKNAYNVIPDLRRQELKVGLNIEDWILSTPAVVEI